MWKQKILLKTHYIIFYNTSPFWLCVITTSWFHSPHLTIKIKLSILKRHLALCPKKGHKNTTVYQNQYLITMVTNFVIQNLSHRQNIPIAFKISNHLYVIYTSTSTAIHNRYILSKKIKKLSHIRYEHTRAQIHFLYLRLSFNFTGRWNCIMLHLGFDVACSNLLIVSPQFCGNSPYPCRSLTYRIY